MIVGLIVMTANGLVRVVSDEWEYEPSLTGYVFIGSQSNPLNEIRFLIGNNGGIPGPRIISVCTIPPSVGFANGTAGQYNIGAQLRNGQTLIEVPTAVSDLRLTPSLTGAAVCKPRVWAGKYADIQLLGRQFKWDPIQAPKDSIIIVLITSIAWTIVVALYVVYQESQGNKEVSPKRTVTPTDRVRSTRRSTGHGV